MSYYLLKQNDFPSNEFFTHLQKGVEYYQRGHFQRAIWEWFAARRCNTFEPIDIKHIKQPVQLQCNLRETSLLFCFYVIYLNNLSGFGQLYSLNTNQKFTFKNGFLCFLENTNQEKRIGKYILEKRKDISYEQLKSYISKAGREGKLIGQLMIEKNLLTHKELEDILSQQVFESVSDTLFTQEGEIYFTQKEINEKPHISYSPLKIAFKAAQRRFDVDNFRKEITDNKAIFRTTPHYSELEADLREHLNTNELFVLSLIDGFRNIDQLIRFSGANEESIISILYRLSKKGLIRKIRESAEYEDKEYEEVSKTLGLIFDIYSVIYFQLHKNLGRKTQEVVQKAKSFLDKDRQNLFEDIPIHNPKYIKKDAILKNMAKYYPTVDQRFIFIDIFGELFDSMLRESQRFLGNKLHKKIMEEFRRTLLNLENLSAKTAYSDRLITIIKNLVAETHITKQAIEYSTA